MVTDFGSRPRKRGAPVGWIILGFWMVALLGAAGAKWYLDRQAAIKVAQVWAASGPPCPPGTPPQDDGYQPGQRAFGFEGTKYLSDYRTAKCGTALDHGGVGPGEVAVCKLKGATYINVSTATSRSQFLTSGGNATISIGQGAPSCVLDAG
jgi:hypothetical protein